LGAAVFGLAGFFFGAGFAVFEGLGDRADFAAALGADFVLRFGMNKSLCSGLPEIRQPEVRGGCTILTEAIRPA
jgi:hypothetical protein